jgi:hypothetical protein
LAGARRHDPGRRTERRGSVEVVRRPSDDALRGQRLPGIPGHFSRAQLPDTEAEPRKALLRFPDRVPPRVQRAIAAAWAVFLLALGVFALIWQIVTGEGGGGG